MLWQHAWDVVGEAAAGDMREPLDGPGLADRAQAGFHVEPRRRQQRAAQRHDRRERRRCVEDDARLRHDLADQREAVGVHPRRGQSDHRVAHGNISARQQRAALGRSDRKAREVVIAVLVESRHLGGFAADQGATGFPAPLGDAGHNRRSRFRIELAAGKIVEEEQRFRALHHEVVDRHRHQVDADAAMQAGLDRDLDLGADAVGRRHQHGVLETRRLEVEQAAESAYFGVRPRPGGGADHRLDEIDQAVARIDIDARIRVSEPVFAVDHAQIPV